MQAPDPVAPSTSDAESRGFCMILLTGLSPRVGEVGRLNLKLQPANRYVSVQDSVLGRPLELPLGCMSTTRLYWLVGRELILTM